LWFIQQIDVAVYTFLNGFAGNWLLDRMIAEEEANQLLKGGLFLALYWYAWFRQAPAQARRRRQIVTATVGTLAALGVARLLATALPFRVRPMFEHGLPHTAFAIPIHPNMEAWSAFPSDTATYFFALAFGMTYVERAIGRWLLLFTTTYICTPRLYIGLHYLTDIVAGLMVGILIVRQAMRSPWIEKYIAAPIVEAAEARSGAFYAISFLLSMEMANLFDSTRALLHAALRAARMGPHYVLVALSAAVAVAAVAAAVAVYAWRRRTCRRRMTAAM
jgi:undecaprenyl-diphosphatase